MRHITSATPSRAILIHRPVLTFDGDVARQGDEEEAAFHGKLPPGFLPHGLPTVKEVQPAVTAAPVDKKEEEKDKKGRYFQPAISSYDYASMDTFVEHTILKKSCN